MSVRGRPPAFWRHGEGGIASLLLAPVGLAVGRATTRRASRPGVAPGVPVLCCGNATVGGAGKTILALELAARLRARGCSPHLLTRGHGGRAGSVGPLRVDPASQDASTVGDEALLLAREAPCWVSRDRVAGARAAIATGADCLVMDDGLQNPGLAKTASFLVVDGPAGFGNGRRLPAGPLRESPRDAAARCRAIVRIGPDETGAVRTLAGIAPILGARLVPGPEVEALRGRPVVAFAGIGRPEKFFAMLRDAGVELARAIAFADHHSFSARDLDGLARVAAADDAVLATTEKDLVRLPLAFRAQVAAVPVALAWDDGRLDLVLDAVLGVQR